MLIKLWTDKEKEDIKESVRKLEELFYQPKKNLFSSEESDFLSDLFNPNKKEKK